MRTPARNGKQGAKWIRREKRLAIYLRDGLACAWCGESIEDGAELTLDHCKPNSHGGSNDPSNLVTACRRCNTNRGTRSVAEFAKIVGAYTDMDPTTIRATIRRCRRRKIDVAEAKVVIARRGSYAAALQPVPGARIKSRTPAIRGVCE